MAAIDLNTVRSTIEGRLATELASSPVIPVVFSNMSFDSTTEDTFVQCETTFGGGRYLANGVNVVVGLVTLNIFTEEGIGSGANYVIAVTEDNIMFKSWLKDLNEYTEVHMKSRMRDKIHPNTLVGTDGYRDNLINMTPGQYPLINKIRQSLKKSG